MKNIENYSYQQLSDLLASRVAILKICQGEGKKVCLKEIADIAEAMIIANSKSNELRSKNA